MTMMRNLTKLNEVIGTNRIFHTIMENHELPWSEDDTISAQLLDFEYLYNYSGRKIISPAVERCLENGEIPAADFLQLCDVAYMMFNKKWARNWAILTMEYDPIENYSMTEHQVLTRDNQETHSGTDRLTQTGTDTHAESGTNTLLMTGTDTHTESGKDTVKNTGTDNTVKTGSEALAKAGTEADTHTGGYTDTNNNLVTEHEISAFNSSGYSDSSKDTTTGNTSRTYNNDAVTKSFTSRTDTTTYNSVTDAETKNLQDETTYGHQDQETRNMSDSTTFGHTDTETLNRTDQNIHGHQIDNDDTETTDLTRSGNIGTTTTQMMLESEKQLWRWNFFYEVFNDIDHVFTITTY